MVATSYRFDPGRRHFATTGCDANIIYVCVAQLDRALGYGPRCREFESSHARTINPLKPFGFRGFCVVFLGWSGYSIGMQIGYLAGL